MNQVWIIVAVLVGVLVLSRIRSRRAQQQRQSKPPAAGPRIQGFQLSAYLHPRMGSACLFGHGLQFGRGFRRKEGPHLPHDANCRCVVLPFSFTSSEVFNGALRGVGGVKGSVEGLSDTDAAQLLERLKAVETGPLPASAQAYATAVGLEAFPRRAHPALEAFLAERHAHLQTRREPAALGETPATEAMGTAKS